jgi:hypothetical protein
MCTYQCVHSEECLSTPPGCVYCEEYPCTPPDNVYNEVCLCPPLGCVYSKERLPYVLYLAASLERSVYVLYQAVSIAESFSSLSRPPPPQPLPPPCLVISNLKEVSDSLNWLHLSRKCGRQITWNIPVIHSDVDMKCISTRCFTFYGQNISWISHGVTDPSLLYSFLYFSC